MVLAVVGIGAVAALLAVMLRAPTGTPDPVAAPRSEPTTPAITDPPSPAGSESSSPPAGRRVDLTALAEQVAQIRELPLEGRLRARVLRAEALAEKVSEIAFSEIDTAEVAADERLLVALRLAPPDTDLVEIMESLYREQILGLYVPEEETLYVKAGADRDSAAQQLTSAHEITHALQDRSFGLVDLQEAAEDDSEAALALLSLIEGDAVLTQQLWSEAHQTADQRQEAFRDSSTGGDALANAPQYLRASLFFPYEHGVRFTLALYSSGGFDAIDAAYADPPTTSEQILHPEKYQAGEGAAAVRVAGRPGNGWRNDANYPFGEFDLQQMLLAVGPAEATVVGEGWGGGKVRSWTRDGEIAVAFALSFDTAADAHEACDALPRWYAQVANARETEPGLYEGDRDHLALECAGDEVTAGLAAAPELARRLAGQE